MEAVIQMRVPTTHDRAAATPTEMTVRSSCLWLDGTTPAELRGMSKMTTDGDRDVLAASQW